MILPSVNLPNGQATNEWPPAEGEAIGMELDVPEIINGIGESGDHSDADTEPILQEQFLTDHDDSVILQEEEQHEGEGDTTISVDYSLSTSKHELHESIQEEDEDGPARSQGTIQFKVNIASSLGFGDKTIFSPPIHIRELAWKIMVVPRSDRERSCMGVFVQCDANGVKPDGTDIEREFTNWHISAQATIRLINQDTEGVDEGRRNHIEKKIAHTFHSKENDWGYSNFIDWATLRDPREGYVRHNILILEAHIQADAPHGTDWNSKLHSGYVGLRNQGATCYMNSLLQTMFFTNQLRKAVYKMPTEIDDSTKSVALALQRVFYELQTSDRPVGTKKLTTSFGWETLDSFMQHDVQEFLRVLLDKLESKMNGTCVEGTVPKLFEGGMISFVKCKHVQYESSRSETFYDIQLSIKNKKDVYESFDDYIATEVLDGDNKYDAGSHGLQEAEKGVIFTSFPPVLHLHLMRFQYDPISDSSVKSNDRFEFYEKINLEKYLKMKDPSSIADAESTAYTLHAVLVHSGDNNGGHYVVFINPRGDGKWCKFDDDVVFKCTKAEAIQHNFGGHEHDDEYPSFKQSTSAYMLVYIRDSDLATVVQDVGEQDVPSGLLDRLQEENNLEMLRKQERSQAHLYTHVTVITEDAFVGHQGTDLYDADKLSPAAVANSRIFKILKTTKPHQLLETIAETYGVNESRLRLWPFRSRRNKGIRPDYLEMQSDPLTEEEEIQFEQQLPIFLEMLPVDDEKDSLTSFDKDNDVILFLRMYDPESETLHYCGHWCGPLSTSFAEIMEVCRQRADWGTDNVSINLYTEVRQGQLEIVTDPSTRLNQKPSQIANGDILVFHREFDQFSKDFKSLPEFYTYIQYKCDITFTNKKNNSESFVLELSLKSTYMGMARAVGTRCEIDPLHIQFSKNASGIFPNNIPFPNDHSIDLLSILNLTEGKVSKSSMNSIKFLYQDLGIPVAELHRKKQIKLLFYTPASQEGDPGSEREIVFYVPKRSDLVVQEVLDEMTKVLNQESNDKPPVKRLRLLEISSHRIQKIIEADILADILQSPNYRTMTRSYCYYRAEEIPPEEEIMRENECLIEVAHFHRNTFSTFGVPFLIKLASGEMWGDVKARIIEKAGSGKDLGGKGHGLDWTKVQFAIVSPNHTDYLDEKHDTQPVRSDLPHDPTTFALTGRPWIGLEHVNANKSLKRSRFSHVEKAIKIYN